jgi:hypothetical protein
VGATERRELVELLVASPAGAALLAKLETDQRAGMATFDVARDSDPASVERAVRWVGEHPFGDLVAVIVEAAEHIAGPWTAGAPGLVASCLQQSPARAPIAAEIARRFLEDLERPLVPAAQEWWSSAPRTGANPRRPGFADYENVYGNGEFTWAGLWTVTDPPEAAHDVLLSAWEIGPGPITRWRLPVNADARVFEIHRPADWEHLVRSYPRRAPRAHGGWELPGPNQDVDEIRGLLAVPGQSAARTDSAVHLLPDWRAVSSDYDGVHLSWAGFLTTEGRVCDLGADTVTMLRYWHSERTHWLADVFAEPEPLPAPQLTGAINGDEGADATADPAREAADRAVVATLLGR